MIEPNSQKMTIGRMRFACWIPKTTNTHSEYVILIAFPLQQLLHERAHDAGVGPSGHLSGLPSLSYKFTGSSLFGGKVDAFTLLITIT
jgi:hypothetical protein